MNQKNFNKTDANSSTSDSLRVPYVARPRHHSETIDDRTIRACKDLINIDNLDHQTFVRISKLGSSAPNDRWYAGSDHLADDENDQTSIINSDYSANELSDDDQKAYSKLLKVPVTNAIFSRSTGRIDSIESNHASKKTKKSSKNSVRKRKRCYSMDERRNLKNDLNIPFSFVNLAYNNKENLSDISEPLSSSEKSNEELTKQISYRMINDKNLLNNKKLIPPIIKINEPEVKFDFICSDDENDKSEDKELLISNHNLRSSQINIENGSDESDEQPERKFDEIEFTTKMASELSKAQVKTESLISFFCQVLFPLLFCGLGCLLAGLFLHRIESYQVFKTINGLSISIPSLMGLKGNLEMTMVSRLSTAANNGFLQNLNQILEITISNICLLQIQSTVVSLLSSLYGVYSYIENIENTCNNKLLVASNEMTANMCCILLGIIMIAIIVFCNHRRLNPDNIATPIASSMGDVSTVLLLGFTSSFMYDALQSNNNWLSGLILLIIIIVTPFSLMVALKHKETKNVLKTGWLPIIASMLISNIAGVILDIFVKRYAGFELFLPIINGVGGNLAAIQSSRISTYLHKTCRPGHLPVKELSIIDSKVMLSGDIVLSESKNSESNITEASYIQLDERMNDLQGVGQTDLTNENNTQNNINDSFSSSISPVETLSTNYDQNELPNYAMTGTRKIIRIRRKKIRNYLQKIFSSGDIHEKCARLLILITLPMHILYYYLIQLIQNYKLYNDHPLFIILYLIAALSQMTILLYLAKKIVYWLWKRGYDPDNWAIPILTSIGDLLGTSFLALLFYAIITPSSKLIEEDTSCTYSNSFTITSGNQSMH